jgi:hypothetical protein
MLVLTRRRDPQAQGEPWRIRYQDIEVGMIGIRSGAPFYADQWQWRCGLSHRGRRDGGTAPYFSTARAASQKAWLRLLPEITPADLADYPARARPDAAAFAVWRSTSLELSRTYMPRTCE